jgi:hypothetical protein
MLSRAQMTSEKRKKGSGIVFWIPSSESTTTPNLERERERERERGRDKKQRDDYSESLLNRGWTWTTSFDMRQKIGPGPYSVLDLWISLGWIFGVGSSTTVAPNQ